MGRNGPSALLAPQHPSAGHSGRSWGILRAVGAWFGPGGRWRWLAAGLFVLATISAGQRNAAAGSSSAAASMVALVGLLVVVAAYRLWLRLKG